MFLAAVAAMFIHTSTTDAWGDVETRVNADGSLTITRHFNGIKEETTFKDRRALDNAIRRERDLHRRIKEIRDMSDKQRGKTK